MYKKIVLTIAVGIVLGYTGNSQNTPVFGSFCKEVKWSNQVAENWIYDRTVYYGYGYVGEFLVVLWEETRIQNNPVSRRTYSWIYQGMPLNIQTTEQVASGNGWADVSRILFEWEVSNHGSAWAKKYLFQVKVGDDWVTQFGNSSEQEYNSLNQVVRQTNYAFNAQSGNFEPLSRDRYSYDHYNHRNMDTLEMYSDGEWHMANQVKSYFPQHVDSLMADSVISSHWVPADETWALSWWKPDLRYRYHRSPLKLRVDIDRWDDIGLPNLLHWDTLYKEFQEIDQNGNMLLMTREKWKDEHSEPGFWKMEFGQQWDITWSPDTIPLERMYKEWILPETGEAGYWSTLTKEEFVTFFSLGVPGPAIDDAGISLYPNPFRDRFRIEFTGPADSPATIQVMDLSGRLLFQGLKPSGSRLVTLDPLNLQAGPCLIRILYPDGTARMVRALKI